MKPMKTPGVYIVEKSAFPNSVVQVATAVPAFIGYTQKAMMGNKSLHMTPKRLASMAEFEDFFGGPAPVEFDLKVVPPPATPATPPNPMNLTALPEAKFNIPGSSQAYMLEEKSKGFCLYGAMRLFFQNGGGPCYIVSVGSYADDIDGDNMLAGIKPLIKEQEPTMLVIPETTRLTRANSAKVQQQMLMHCGNKMKNRFAIVDIHGGFRDLETDKGEPVAEFRNDIGTNHLDFGAAYYPWLNSSIYQSRDFTFENISTTTRPLLGTLLKNSVNPSGETATGPLLLTENEIDNITPPAKNSGEVVINEVKNVVVDLNEANDNLDLTQLELKDADAAPATKTKKTIADVGVWTLVKATGLLTFKPDPKYTGTGADVEWTGKTKAVAAIAADPNATPPVAAVAAVAAANASGAVKITLSDPPPTAENIDKTLRAVTPLYTEIMNEIMAYMNTMPPAAAMAGLYTMVDGTRGVWKAPANVSVNSVTSPTVNISHDDQEDLNVTPQGKSINAIRPFVGEGTLVWGARTLDGNSLDWRYINVRRTMIMLEESIRLASKAYVFEPNVANTWVTIRSMIENFLRGVWKQGGLAGAVPEDAFSVHVGLGETMTPVDILEGILKVTVLVAVSRPAEFIEITFQQQMQKS